jgi:heme/copper-type cytochrome/quinol oxidase subunit 3
MAKKKINKDLMLTIFILVGIWFFLDAIYIAMSLLSGNEVFGQDTFVSAFFVSIGVELITMSVGILLLMGIWSFHKTIFKGLRDENYKEDSSK